MLVVGLGNPGDRYAVTRHNVGFRVVDHLAESRGIDFKQGRCGGRLGVGWLRTPEGEPFEAALLEPHTFMNRSGDAVVAAVRELEIGDPARDLIVVFDDVDLPFGRLRVRPKGGPGGQKGLAHVIARLAEIGIEAAPRLRFGIGRPGPRQETTDYVLEPFSLAEEKELPGLIRLACEAVEMTLGDGVVSAMNRFNRDPTMEDSSGRP